MAKVGQPNYMNADYEIENSDFANPALLDNRKVKEWLLARHSDRISMRFSTFANQNSPDSCIAARMDLEAYTFFAGQVLRDYEELDKVRIKYWKRLEGMEQYVYGARQTRLQYFLVLAEWLHEIGGIMGRGRRIVESKIKFDSSRSWTPKRIAEENAKLRDSIVDQGK